MDVYYERLVAEPEQTVRSICEFAGLAFREEMMRYYAGAVRPRWGEDSDVLRRGNLPPTAGLRDWRRQMTPRDIEDFEAGAGDLLEDLGYERLGSSHPSARVRARGSRAVWNSRRVIRRAREVVADSVSRRRWP